MNDCFERLKEEAILCSKQKGGNTITLEQESRLDRRSSDGSNASSGGEQTTQTRNGGN